MQEFPQRVPEGDDPPSALPPRASAEHLPPEHCDFVLDAGLLPLQRLFRDALDGDHLPRGLLPRHHHLGERAAARHTGRKLLSYAARPVLTQKNLITGELTEATHRQTGQSTQTTYWEYLLRTGRDHPTPSPPLHPPGYGQRTFVLANAWCSCAA